MGNRANVIFTNEDETSISPCVYLHWNGGPESIYSFIEELNRRNIRQDQNYECSRFIQVVGDFFDQDSISGLSLGVTNGPKAITIQNLGKISTDQSDNGFYIVCRSGKNIRMRRFVYNYTDDGLEEMSKGKVKEERINAYKSDYIEKLKKAFIAIQGSKPMDNE